VQGEEAEDAQDCDDRDYYDELGQRESTGDAERLLRFLRALAVHGSVG
jgi:hypothetical protein